MKLIRTIVASTSMLSAAFIASEAHVFASAPVPPSGPMAPPSNTPTPTCADTCGYAVVSPDGVVHGVIVCQEGCFGGTMPHDYMGCPAGCSLVLQAPKDSNGNVAGIHGPDVIYNPNNNTFERTNPNDGQIDWSLESGQPLDNAYVRPPETTVPPSQEEPAQDLSPEINVPDSTQPGDTTPTTEAPSGSVEPLSYRNGISAFSGATKSSFFTRFIQATSKANASKSKQSRVVTRPTASVMRIVRF